MTKINFISSFFKKERKTLLFIFGVSLFFSFFILSGNYFHLPVSNAKGYILFFFHWIIISLGYTALIYTLALNKWIFSFFFPLLNLIFAALIFYVVSYDISVNTALIESALNTNIEEASGLISLKLIIYLIFIFSFSLISVIIRIKKVKIQQISFHLVVIIVLSIIPYTVNKIRSNTVIQRVPFSFFASIHSYYGEVQLLKQKKIDISSNSSCTEDSLTVVLILGEALRADHLSLNNYSRKTNPLLQKKNIISFSNIHSQWTYTNKSIPYILTRADSLNSKPAYKEESIVAIFKKCGFKTYWIGNQNPGNGFLSFVKNCDTSIINKPMQTVYNLSKKLDEELFSYFENSVKEKNKKKLIIVHLIGSHWYYPSHYPQSVEKFTPVITGKTFSQEEKQKVINSYDNTVLYTDFILNELINIVSNQKSIVFFLSDHGELLGENGKWFHAQNTKFEKNPACILWFSDALREKKAKKIKIAASKRNLKINTDFLFHSILDISGIENPFLNKDLSIFNDSAFTYSKK